MKPFGRQMVRMLVIATCLFIGSSLALHASGQAEPPYLDKFALLAATGLIASFIALHRALHNPSTHLSGRLVRILRNTPLIVAAAGALHPFFRACSSFDFLSGAIELLMSLINGSYAMFASGLIAGVILTIMDRNTDPEVAGSAAARGVADEERKG